jgi:anaerobic magnesium-protoporphyrin IX monomethyl ester cyclase
MPRGLPRGSLLAAFRPDLYGLSFAFFTKDVAFRVLRAVRERFPSLPIVCGGAMPTASPEDVLADAPADVCVLGEGEAALVDLAGHYAGRRPALEGIPGIVFRASDGRFARTAARPPAAIDRIPPPAWELVDFARYKGWHIRMASPQAHVLVSRGCPFDCSYCSNPVWKYGKPWVRTRSPEGIAAEVRLLYGRGVREIYLSADEFNVEERWALEVCRAIEGLGLRDLYFNCNLRPGLVTPALAAALRRINLWVAHLGVESGNDRTLAGVGKGVTLEMIEQDCRVLKGEGVSVFGFVMLYHAWEEAGELRWETPADVDRTLAFCRRLFKARLLDYISWQVATPMPGSRLWATAQRHGLLPGREIRSVFDMNLRLPGLRRADVRRSLRRGLWLKNAAFLRSGRVHFGHVRAVAANLKVMLGLGPPGGAY